MFIPSDVNNTDGQVDIISDVKQCDACADDKASDTLASDDDEDCDTVRTSGDI